MVRGAEINPPHTRLDFFLFVLCGKIMFHSAGCFPRQLRRMNGINMWIIISVLKTCEAYH